MGDREERGGEGRGWEIRRRGEGMGDREERGEDGR